MNEALTCEGLLVRGRQVQAKHLYYTAAHEVDVRYTGCVHKLGVLHKGTVHPLQSQHTVQLISARRMRKLPLQPNTLAC